MPKIERLKHYLRPFYVPLLDPMVGRFRAVRSGPTPAEQLPPPKDVETIYNLSAKGNPVLIACMPKSGSTYLTKLVCGYSGYPELPLNAHHEIMEFDAIKLEDTVGYGLVSQTHLLASKHTVSVINKHSMRTIVMTRNLLDVVVSRAEFMNIGWKKEIADKDGFYSGTNLIFDPRFFTLSTREMHDYVIDLVVPWYLMFYVSWRKYESQLDIPPLWVSYESLFADTEATAEKIISHLEIPRPQRPYSEIVAGISHTRLNVGKSGRGIKLLSPANVRKIEKLISHFPDYADELVQW